MRIEEKNDAALLSYLHDIASRGNAALLREIGVMRRQFLVYGMHLGFADTAPMPFG